MQAAFPNSYQPTQRGLLLIGHGTRENVGLAEFLRLAGKVIDQLPECAVEPCFLELGTPDIPAAVHRLLDRGFRHLTVAPLLLFAAGHAQRDIPAAVAAGIQSWPGPSEAKVSARIKQLPPLECHPRIVELSTERYCEALRDRDTVDPSETMLLLVARGSSYPESIAEMHRFARLREERFPIGKTEVCFAAVAQPDLAEGLRRAAASPFRRIVVQPHLLFTGRVRTQIECAVGQMANLQPRKEWIVAAHLGASNLVASAVADAVRVAR